MKKLTVFLFFGILQVFAQKLEIGGFLGGATYKGEYNMYPNPINIRPAGGVFLKHNFTPTSTLRYGLNAGMLHGADQYSNQTLNKLRNGSFNNTILEGSVIYEYNFFDYRENTKTFKISSKWSPYLCGGIGFFISNSITKGKPNGGFCLPVGFGFKHKINKNFNIGAEIVARKTFNDALDGIVDDEDYSKPQLASKTEKDWYFLSCLYISYTIYKVNCPENKLYK
jgi:Domain of unknown function (DUF6089)